MIKKSVMALASDLLFKVLGPLFLVPGLGWYLVAGLEPLLSLFPGL